MARSPTGGTEAIPREGCGRRHHARWSAPHWWNPLCRRASRSA
nr:MAG TPA: hypothetical protein [Caudoviricetes sp.]